MLGGGETMLDALPSGALAVNGVTGRVELIEELVALDEFQEGRAVLAAQSRVALLARVGGCGGMVRCRGGGRVDGDSDGGVVPEAEDTGRELNPSAQQRCS